MTATGDVPVLAETFRNVDFSAHGSRWDGLWEQSFTPWDRGGPSLALNDLLAQRRDLFHPREDGVRPTALIPGCGRGYDVLLLAAFGYDVYGLDYSATATREAVENQKTVEGEELYQLREGVTSRGNITWVTGDFFTDEWLDKTRGVGGTFDLIFDYTFLCALPPEARPKWAKRMAGLLAPAGRLVCLEWPTAKPMSTPGPPWGLRSETYVALLSQPGEELVYDEAGQAVLPESSGPRSDGLQRLALVKPTRTHQAGYNEDGSISDDLSVWSH